MPTVKVNLGDVVAFESLPIGKYLAEIEQIKLYEAADETKNDSIGVRYIVIDGDLLGRKQSEFLSFSEKAAFMMKRWFNRFELGDIEDITFDDDTLEMTYPDLIGSRVIFEVKADAKARDGLRTSLVSVEENVAAPAEADEAPVVESAAVAPPVSRAVAPRQPVASAAPKRTLR